MVLFLSLAISDIGPVVDIPRAVASVVWFAGLASPLLSSPFLAAVSVAVLAPKSEAAEVEGPADGSSVAGVSFDLAPPPPNMENIDFDVLLASVDDGAGVDSVAAEELAFSLAFSPTFAPNNELAESGVVFVGLAVDDVAGAALLVAAPNKEDAEDGGASFLPNKLVADDPVSACLPPNRDEAESELAGLAAAPPKSEVADVPGADADSVVVVEGAPAGVVDGINNEGLAGVVALCVSAAESVLGWVPNTELPVFPNELDDGSAAGVEL